MNKTTHQIVEEHLRKYLKRTQDLWITWNEALDSWFKKNPSNGEPIYSGSIPDFGISKWSKHGVGVRIECDNEIIEFDFIPKHVEKVDYLDIEEIDIYWSFAHFKSLNSESKISEEDWIKSIEDLHENGILTKFSWNRCAFKGYKLKEEKSR